MRRSWGFTILPGQSWPASAGGQGAALQPFTCFRIHNRTASATPADVVVSLGDEPQNDATQYFDKVPSGKAVMRNVGSESHHDPLPHELHIRNVDANNTATIWLEISDQEILDSRSSEGAPGQSFTGNNGDAVAATTAGNAQSDSYGYGWNGATWDRERTVSSVGDGLGVAFAMQPSSNNPPASAVPAANTAAILTFGAVAGQIHRLTWLCVSYSATPTAGRLTVSDGTNNILDVDVTAAGPQVIPLPPGGLLGRTNAALTVTLAAAGAAVVGKVSAAKLTA